MSQQFPQGVAVVGVGDTDYGRLYRERDLEYPRDPYDLALQAFKSSLDDSGLSKDEIDGVICVRDVSSYETFCTKAGIKHPRLVNYLLPEGRQSGLALQYAAMAVSSGMANNVLIIYSNVGRSAGVNYGSSGDGADPFGLVHGMTSPGAHVASMFERYMYEYNVTPESLANVAISNRYHASMNPNAVFKEPLTVDDYMNSRYIAEPLHLYDYCLINDGAVAIIVSSVEKAKSLQKPVVELLSTSTCGDMGPTYAKEDFFYSALQKASDDVYSLAGVSQEDIDCLQIYDNFTPVVFFGLEGIGFCGKGEAPDYLKQYGSMVGKSSCPINTSGSHTSETYMQGFNLHVEAVRQLRHECGERQVKDCELVQYVCPSPIVSSHILARR
ncbi:thiolase family protein [Salirhabdus salicampi]|uniref:thiolase family protein n=1 Tax=Salirhabdus salicampi TaxID=476102 RepID=UPI0020C48912|nr:thiolase family protein [Salirhabdus salicampi]MCP8615249.1 thiolase family protein [Salirhabdus salicampi]